MLNTARARTAASALVTFLISSGIGAGLMLAFDYASRQLA